MKYCPKCKKEVDPILKFKRFRGYGPHCPYCDKELPRTGGLPAISIAVLSILVSPAFVYIIFALGVVKADANSLIWVAVFFIATYALLLLYCLYPDLAE